MKFKFDGVEKISSKIRIFLKKIWKDSRCWNEIKIMISNESWPTRSNHISQTFHIDHLTEEDKKSNSYEGSDSNKIESSYSEDDMISEGSENEINENESQQEVSPRLKHKEIREKLRAIMMQEYLQQKSSQKIFLD